MASLSSLYIKTETIREMVEVLEKKGDKGIELTISLNDEANTYGQNVSSWVSQTKEQREAKKKRFFTGNGKTYWTKGETPVPPRQEQVAQTAPAPASEETDDLPF